MFQAVNIHPDVDDCIANTREAIIDLSGTLEQLATQAGAVTGLLDTITRAMGKVPDPKAPQQRVSFILDSADSYVDYQTRMVSAAKEIARLAQEMVEYFSYSLKLYTDSLLYCCHIIGCYIVNNEFSEYLYFLSFNFRISGKCLPLLSRKLKKLLQK